MKQEKSEAKVIRQRIAFQKRQERKTVSSFCGVALYFAPNFNVERLAVLVDWYIKYKDENLSTLFGSG